MSKNSTTPSSHLFDTITNRHQTYSVKWERDIPTDVLPMWVADTDFQAPPSVIHALQQAVEHGVFGYSFVTKEVKETVCHWLHNRHHYSVEEEALLFHHGVVPSIATIIHALTDEGDKIVVQPPVYPPFINLVKQNKRVLCENPLIRQNGKYEIDFEGFEETLKQGVKLFILCSPHNPVGRVWHKKELQRLVDLCEQYGTTIISDEIHHDLVLFNHQHIPTATLTQSQDIITLMAPSKTFNIAGLKASIIICNNSIIREKIQHHQQCLGSNEVNKAGIVALYAAYKDGEKWLEEQLSYLEENVRFTKFFLETHLPHVQWIEPEGTYLLWLDFAYYENKIGNIKGFLEKEAKVLVEDGPRYGTGGEGFIRLNIGTQKARLEEGLNRIAHALNSELNNII